MVGIFQAFCEERVSRMEYQCLLNIRECIRENNLIQNPPNVSLILDKYYPCPQRDKRAQNKSSSSEIVEKVSSASNYTLKYVKEAKGRILKSIIIPLEQSIGRENFFCIVGKLKSNLAINLTTRFDNSGISLERRTGVPIIWGSAVKGCCAHARIAEMPTIVADEAALKENLYLDTFGGSVEIKADSTSKQKKIKIFKGKVDFFSAFMVGANNSQNPIETDIITPHKDNSPIPIYFPVVESGASFVFIVALNKYGLYGVKEGRLVKTSAEYRAKILDYAKYALLEAFELGVGAKTSSGFGWFEEDKSESDNFINSLQKVKTDIAENKRAVEAERELESMTPIEKYRHRLEAAPTNGQGKDASFLSDEAKNLKNKSVEEQKVFIKVMMEVKKDALKSWRKKGKQEYTLIEEVAKSLGIILK